MSQITTVGKFAADLKKEDRTITTTCPRVLEVETLEELAGLIGSDVCMNKIKAQLTVDYRAKIRGMLTKLDDNGDIENTDETIMAEAEKLVDWVPVIRVRKSEEEKAMESISGLSSEADLDAIMAAIKAKKKELANAQG